MEKMEVDDVVDLSIASGRDASLTITQSTARDLRALTQNSGLTITPAPPPPPPPQAVPGIISVGVTSAIPAVPGNNSSGATFATSASSSVVAPDNVVGHDANRTRRVLRPRTEPRSYAESPDIVLLPAKINGRQQNGNIDSETDDDDDDEEMPPIYPIKELTPAELWERERGLRKLREELRNEETKLVLLKKLKQSQQMMKENLIVTPTNLPNTNNPLAAIPAALTKGTLSVTTTTAIPLPAHNKNRSAILRGQPTPGRTTSVLPPPRTAALPGVQH
uniref:Transcriptional repressor p66 coiled-coil MBD2-interaction domain-containing protein n=1 Tax=Lutzomyia longipalpis TaxID=7200 RepID=A0A1B0GKA5_LUTLO